MSTSRITSRRIQGYTAFGCLDFVHDVDARRLLSQC